MCSSQAWFLLLLLFPLVLVVSDVVFIFLSFAFCFIQHSIFIYTIFRSLVQCMVRIKNVVKWDFILSNSMASPMVMIGITKIYINQRVLRRVSSQDTQTHTDTHVLKNEWLSVHSDDERSHRIPNEKKMNIFLIIMFSLSAFKFDTSRNIHHREIWTEKKNIYMTESGYVS